MLLISIVNIISMDPFAERHQTAPAIEELSHHLHVDADHAIAGLWQHKWNGKNRIPHNRLFLIYGPGQAGHIAWGEDQRMQMRPGHCYHMPPNIELDFEFAAGLRMVAFHYDCHLNNPLDLCAGINHVSEAACSLALIDDLAVKVRNIHMRSELVWIQGILMQLASQFIPGDIQSLSEQHRIQQRYEAVNEEIELAGAAARINTIAEIMQLSIDQLSKRFRRDIGISLKHYIDQVITRRASNLLRHSDKQIKEIAEELNFRDEFTFSRFIKKHLHLSPRQYRQLGDIERV